MFGNKKRVIEKSGSGDGVEASAVVLQGDGTGGNRAGANIQRRNRIMKVRVEPEGQPTFEVAFHQTFEKTYWLVAGHLVKVIYDPGDPSKLAILEDEPFLWPGESQEHGGRDAKIGARTF